MIKKMLALFILLMAIVPPVSAQEYMIDAGTREDQPGLTLEGVSQYIERLNEETRRVVPDLNFRDLVIKAARGQTGISPAELPGAVTAFFFKELVANSSILGKLVILTMICAVLQNLTASFERGTTGRLAHMVTFLVLVSIAAGSFALALNAGREVVDKMATFMQVVLPILLTLLVAVGGVATASIFQPVIFVSISIIATIIKNVVLPLIMMSAVLSLAGSINPKIRVTNMAGLLRTVSMWIMGLMGTVFLGLLSIQGVAGSVGDSVALRTAKFATGAFIPVVGGMFSDALEAIISSSLLIKNAVGIAGMVVVLAIMIVPLVKIACLAFIYKLASAIIQPVDDGQMSTCLNDLGSGLFSVFGAVSVTGLLFFFTMAIIVAVGNATVMMR